MPVIIITITGLAIAAMAGVRIHHAAQELAARPVVGATPDPVVAPGSDVAPAIPASPTTSNPTAALSREARIADEAHHIPVTIYSASYCGWCRKAKAHMDARGISYVERRVDESADAKRDLARIGGNGVPTFEIEGEVHSGYDPSWVESTIRRRAELRVASR